MYTATTEVSTLSLHDALPIFEKISEDVATQKLYVTGMTGAIYDAASPDGAHHSLHPQIKDRKSTRLNSSHGYTSYAVFCVKTKNTPITKPLPGNSSLPYTYLY